MRCCPLTLMHRLAALMTHPEYNMRELYRPGMPKFQPAMSELATLLQRCLPALSEHLSAQGVQCGMYASQASGSCTA